MNRLLDFLRRRFAHGGDGGTQQPALYLDAQVDAIQYAESTGETAPGRLIHRFHYHELDLRLDRDVTGLYRVTVNEGKERVYSFTVKTPPGDYEALRASYADIARFLDGERRLADLPNNERLKGRFYGQGE